jgi:hypothetical protein
VVIYVIPPPYTISKSPSSFSLSIVHSTLTASMAQVNMGDLSTTQEKQVTIVTTNDDSDNVLSPQEWAELDEVAKIGFTKHDQRDMQRMGKKQQFRVR